MLNLKEILMDNKYITLISENREIIFHVEDVISLKRVLQTYTENELLLINEINLSMDK